MVPADAETGVAPANLRGFLKEVVMTKPIVKITHECIPESYDGTDIWIVIHAKPSQKVDEDAIKQLIESTLKANECEAEEIE